MPLILSGNVGSAVSGVFEVENSCRFNGSDSYLHWTDTGQSGSALTLSISLWCKKCSNGVFNPLVLGRQNGDNFTLLQFDNSDRLDFYSETSNAIKGRLRTNRKFSDPGAWYHILAIWDGGNATAGNRMRLYVNGVEETSFETDTNPDEDQNSWFNLINQKMHLGYDTGDLDVGHSSATAFNGYIAQFMVVDGVIKGPTDFGEFDSDSPTIWKPKDISGEEGTGTNGALLLFKDSSALGANEHGADAPNDDWTAVNLAATDQCVDTPTNNFCTMNSLDNQRQGYTFAEGNCKITSPGGGTYDFVTGTMGVSAGKWYWETKIITIPTLDYIYNGISDHVQFTANWDLGGEAGQYCLSRVAGKIKLAEGAETTFGGSMSANDIQSFALDADNNKLYIANGGEWSTGSGAWDSTTFDANTGAVTIAHATAIVGASDFWFPALGNGANVMVMSVNFGNPDYANSSSAADENGYGDFEFAPPTGYLALCSKNLGSDGG